MPIDYSKYPNDWPEIRQTILTRADNKCELCGAGNYRPHPVTGSKVILTVHHIDHDITNNRPYNLMAACQKCHLRLDLPNKINKRKEKKRMLTEKQAGEKLNFTVNVNDELIKEMGKEVIEKVRDFLKRYDMEKSEVDIDIRTEREPGEPYKIKLLITIYRKVI